MSGALTPADLSPWAQIGLFRVPVETVINGTGAVLQIAGGNPLRHTLVISNNTSGIIYVSTNPGVKANTGIAIGTAFGSMILTARDHGPLTTYPWYWLSTSLQTLTVLEGILDEWPNPVALQTDGSYADPASLPYASDPADNDVRWDYGHSYSPGQSAADRIIRRLQQGADRQYDQLRRGVHG